MSSRSESKQAAREARLAAEQEQAARQRRQRVWALAGGAALLAAIVVVVLIVISAGGSDSDDDGGDLALFDGIPQRGIELGDPKAPVTLVEFADPQCPFCKAYTAEKMPELIDRYVKGGDLRMELQLLTFIGPDSEGLARAAYAAADQNRIWQFMDVAYARQEAENSGYADQAFIDGVADAAGVDADRITEQSDSEAVTAKLEDAKSAAADAGVQSTPGFLVGPTGGNLQVVSSQDDLTAAIDEQLAAAK